MNIITDKSTLLPALLRVANIVEKTHTLPILLNLLMEAKNNHMAITATDMEVQLNVQLPVQTDESTAFTVPARKITDICKALPDDTEIKLQVQQDAVIVHAGRGRYRLSCLPAADYPDLKTDVAEHQLKISPERLYRILYQTQFAMANQDVRYYLNGLLLEIRHNQVRAVATDGHRLALSELFLDEKKVSEEEIQYIIPRKAVLELLRILHAMPKDEDSNDLVLRFSSTHMSIQFDDGQFTSKLINGRYPDYEKVFSNQGNHTLIIERNELKQALQRAAILSNEKFRGVEFELSADGRLVLKAHNPENEESEEELENVQYQGPSLRIAFNIRYLLDVLNVLGSEKVQFDITDAVSSCLITGVEENDQARYVVMPMTL